MMSHGDIACRALALLALGFSGCTGDDPTPIRQGSGYRLVPRFSGRAAVPRPLVGTRVPQHPFMAAGGSSMLIVENNAGYDIFPTMMFGRTGAGGVARVDLDDDGEGCHVVWQSGEVSQTAVPKLSLGNGLLYLYTKLPGAPWWTDAYYLTAVDFRTGETVYGVLTGTGLGYDNHWAAITIGPDGTAYVGTLRGLLAVRDGER